MADDSFELVILEYFLFSLMRLILSRANNSLRFILNISMRVVLLSLGGWVMKWAINGASGFFVTLALIASVVGVMCDIFLTLRIRSKAAFATVVALAPTMLAMGFVWKENNLDGENPVSRTMGAFSVILLATQFIYTLTCK